MAIRHVDTVKTMYDRAVELIEGIKTAKNEKHMLIEGRKGATSSIQRSKTHSSHEEKIAQADNDIKEKETELKSITQNLMTIQIGREVESSSAAAASSSGAGRYKGRGRPRAKTASRLKPIKEDEEVVELIKPARNHLPCLDLNNDPYLINKLR